MTDAKSIIKKLKEGGYTSVVHLEKAINAALAGLYLGEQVVNAFSDELTRAEVHEVYLLTDKNRLAVCRETMLPSEKIFKLNDYYYDAFWFFLDGLDLSTSSAAIYKEKGLFGTKFGKITLNNGAEICCPEKAVESRLQTLSKHAKKYSETAKKETSKPKTKKTTSKPVDLVKDEMEKSASANESVIKEIRKLYEDGIITKEELMELIKEALRK